MNAGEQALSCRRASAGRGSAPGSRLLRFGRLALALLRELADENAYRRHLEAHGAQPSGEEWRRFSEERLRARFTRAKCC